MKKEQPRRFNVNQTLNTHSYQPEPPNHNPTDETSFSNQKPPKKKRKFSFKCALLVLFILILTPLLIFTVWNMRNAADASEKLFGTRNVAGALLPTPLKSTSNDRVNVMLMGYSNDDPGHGGADLTDSIMVISLDKKDKTGYMLSIPRDLYVEIPDYGHAKINEAYQAGERQGFNESGYPAGGPGLLEKVITDNFNLPIDYYVIVNYAAVKDIVNALGGITVTIASPDERGIYDPNFKAEEGGPLKLPNGPQKIDGQTALRLTRARGATYGSYGFPQSDFNRTQNQQAVFSAIKAELTPKRLADPRSNKPIFDALAGNLQTDIKLTEVIPLYRLFNSVPDSELKSINLSDVNKVNYLTGYRTRTGQSALIPAAGIDDFSDIQALIEQLSN